MKFILGKKIGMSQMFDEKGNLTPVTLVEAGPCQVLQLKNKEKDGYEAVQVGYVKIEKKNKIKKTMKGKEFKHLCEVRDMKLEEGSQEINVANFAEGDIVKVSGISKGKGFQGGVKRHGFHGKKSATHGNKHEHRTLGSTGTRFPQHVMKGRKMPGRMGAERVSVKGLKIVKIDKENNVIALKGAVPGHRGTLVEIRG